MKEIFKDILGYEGLYQVSNLGNVKSMYTNKILSAATKKRGYQYVNLYKDKLSKMHQIHRLVATAFIPNPNNLPIVNHKDEDPTNNKAENLEWCTHTYNINYGTATKKIRQSRLGNNFGMIGQDAPMYGKHHSEETKKKISESLKAENNHFYGKSHALETRMKISETLKGLNAGANNPAARKVLCITTGEIFSCAKDASNKYRLNHSALCKCCKGISKSCGGMKWKYIKED